MIFQPSQYSQRSAVISMPSVAQLNPATLRQGSSGNTVRTLHAYLMPAIHSSLTGSALGDEYSNKTFGASTDAYVKTFQKAKGLTVDGIVGPNTWSALGLGSPKSSSSPSGTGVADPSVEPDMSDPIYEQPWFVPAVVSVAVLTIGTAIILLKD